MIHIAGPDITIGTQKRQRCAWCGAVLLDYDLTRVATPLAEGETWDGPAMWPLGALVEMDGNVSSVVEHKDGDKLPAGACGRLDHEVTGSKL